MQDKIQRHECAGTFESPEYQEAIGYYNKQFTLRLDPWPEEVIKSFRGMDEDPTVYGTMYSQFTARAVILNSPSGCFLGKGHRSSQS